MIVSYKFCHFVKGLWYLTEILQFHMFFLIFILYRKYDMMCDERTKGTKGTKQP